MLLTIEAGCALFPLFGYLRSMKSPICTSSGSAAPFFSPRSFVRGHLLPALSPGRTPAVFPLPFFPSYLLPDGTGDFDASHTPWSDLRPAAALHGAAHIVARTACRLCCSDPEWPARFPARSPSRMSAGTGTVLRWWPDRSFISPNLPRIVSLAFFVIAFS